MKPVPLKHCPFCGSTARDGGGTVDGVTVSSVRCTNSDCLASFRGVSREQWNTRADFRPGDIVRMKNSDHLPDQYRERDAIVERVGPDSVGQFNGRAFVRFQKRKNRGKEWTDWVLLRDLVSVEASK